MEPTVISKFEPVTDEQLEHLDRETAERDRNEPRLEGVKFDSNSRDLNLRFRNGSSLQVPIGLLKGFDGASAQQIASAKIVSNGEAVYWDGLDVQMTTVAIIQRALKVVTWHESARRGGSAKTKVKSAASRVNGKLGGRPRKLVAHS